MVSSSYLLTNIKRDSSSIFPIFLLHLLQHWLIIHRLFKNWLRHGYDGRKGSRAHLLSPIKELLMLRSVYCERWITRIKDGRHARWNRLGETRLSRSTNCVMAHYRATHERRRRRNHANKLAAIVRVSMYT